MSRTSDSRTAVSNDAYRDNSFWNKGKGDALDGTTRSELDEVAAKAEPTKRDADEDTTAEHASADRVGLHGEPSGVKNNGDDE